MLKPLFIKPTEFRTGDLVFLGMNCDAFLILEMHDRNAVLEYYQYGIKIDTLTENLDQFFSPISFMVAREYA